jgi:hypothetical protein
VRRLHFFPGSVKLRESTGRAGGLPKGNYSKLQASYLFSDIAKRVAAYQKSHPDQEIIKLGF